MMRRIVCIVLDSQLGMMLEELSDGVYARTFKIKSILK